MEGVSGLKVGIVGAGHVGLPTAGALARLGHDVTVTDTDGPRIEALGRAEVPFFEPGLQELIAEGIAAGRLRFTTDPASVAQDTKAVFICVGTPPRASGEANLVAVEKSALAVARHAKDSLVVVEKSTVPTGTSDRLAKALARQAPGVSFQLVSNPEFLREGHAVEDSLHPARVLVGSDSAAALKLMRELYQPIIDSGAAYVETDQRTAELAKHACNAYLALKISFANAMARICELSDADVVSVTNVMGMDPRIGAGHLHAGLGYGGSCFPKDLAAFQRLVERLGYDFPLLGEIKRINDEAVTSVFSKIEEVLWNLEEKRVALLGLSFKPGTDDVRFSPALALARLLIDAGAEVVGYDPVANELASAEVAGLATTDSVHEALEGAHCAVLCTEWDEFRTLDMASARATMAFPIMIDGRNLYESSDMTEAGFTYVPVGRRAASPVIEDRLLADTL
jgi:UDPglucose 6-dehydrogenase